MSRNLEGRNLEGRTVEQEPILPKTGLELIRLAVGEPRMEWLEMNHIEYANDADLTLKAVGENGIVGSFKCRDALNFNWPAPWKYLENIGAKEIKQDGKFSVARSVKERSDGRKMLLILKGVVPYRPDDGGQFFYELSSEALMPLIEQTDREMLTLKQPEPTNRVQYRLTGGIFSYPFPEAWKPLYYKIVDRLPPSETIMIGEGESVARDLLEPALALDKFLREYREEIEALLHRWQ